MATISVIVPCYNQAQFLSDALKSVQEQIMRNWECIIVNDGSHDNTEDVAAEWVKKDARFKYYKKENGGPADARNFGVEHAVGEIILPLDADDKIHENYLSLALPYFQETDQSLIVYCEAELFGESSGRLILQEFESIKILMSNSIFSSALFRKQDWVSVGGYKPELINGFEDWEFWISLIEAGAQVKKINATLFYYRQTENSRSVNITDEKREYLLRQIENLHLKFYAEAFGYPLELYLIIEEEKRKRLLIENSKSYKLVRHLTVPIQIYRKTILWFKKVRELQRT